MLIFDFILYVLSLIVVGVVVGRMIEYILTRFESEDDQVFADEEKCDLLQEKITDLQEKIRKAQSHCVRTHSKKGKSSKLKSLRMQRGKCSPERVAKDLHRKLSLVQELRRSVCKK